jgi:hypothetical protein
MEITADMHPEMSEDEIVCHAAQILEAFWDRGLVVQKASHAVLRRAGLLTLAALGAIVGTFEVAEVVVAANVIQ